MASLPVEVLLGIYLGFLTGIIPALVAWTLGFGFKYFTGVSIPGFGVVVLAVALAGVSGGLLALADPTVTEATNAPTLVTAILVVTALSLYAHAKGDQLGADAPRRLSLSKLRERTLSRDLADRVGGGQVRIRVVGDVSDMEGYPPLSDDLRAEIREAEYTFPADLRVSELEERVAERLRTEFDLGDVAVTIDERGRASVAAAPPFSGLSKRVPAGKRAVSVDALIPTGLARGDEVTLITTDAQVRGTVVSAKTADPASDRRLTVPTTPDPDPDGDAEADEGSTPRAVRAPTTTGGEGRLTAAVTRTDAEPLLRADRARVVVEARGTRLEYELISLLRRSGKRFRRFTVAADSDLDGVDLGTVNARETYGVAILGVRKPTGWQLAPQGTTALAGGDEVFAVGSPDELDAFAGVVA
ncbi:potassium transporter TrkA [Halorientalis sp. IM1011]|uniref:potassium channel family protein n=1 Tax=Halorientalis sp. IM1011 TaxID=1932360 RepID=UPI00097CC2B9|nr:TrkA C-terminal domain-containing protein [Halorientalis sp. IM1011]AQL43482.1 potassium transporter TrkA [Halorientalis sp. IM1011]